MERDMENGPFRMPQPAQRNENEHHPAHHEKPAEESKPVKEAKEEPKAVNRTNRYLSENKSKRPLVAAIVVVIILLAAVAGWWFWNNANSSTGIDTGKYQAVFFTNGQVYFGKLNSFNSDYLKLSDIFYIQAAQASTNPQKTSEDQSSNLQLIKLGNEIHGPQDQMIISKQQVLFYENLKSDSKVSTLIDQYNSQHK